LEPNVCARSLCSLGDGFGSLLDWFWFGLAAEGFVAMNLQEWLEEDRQWLRIHRIAHAKAMFRKAESSEDKQFWGAVVKANAVTSEEARI
jgi:hypothetical protein